MFGKFGLVIFLSVALLPTQSLDRIYEIFHDYPAKSCKSCLTLSPQSSELPVEVFQVYELPLNVHQASLRKTERGYFLKLSIGNSTEHKMIGLRYSLASIDSRNKLQPLVSRTEGFSMPAYDSKALTFKTPLKLNPKDGERLVLMVEQVISHESIWDVMKAKDALEAYARGDYSIAPTVLRVLNQVDAPPGVRAPIYFRRN
jgi:hypothetical protein